MFCKNCGNEIKDGELSCAACGAPAPQPQAQQPEQPQTAEDIIANIIAPKPRKETK